MKGLKMFLFLFQIIHNIFLIVYRLLPRLPRGVTLATAVTYWTRMPYDPTGLGYRRYGIVETGFLIYASRNKFFKVQPPLHVRMFGRVISWSAQI